MIKIDFSHKNLLIFLALSSLLALISAYIAEFGFNLQPCILCLHQRKPFFAILILSIIAIILISNKKYQKLIFFICLILLFSNIVIASYHVGVEQKIFQGPSSCSTTQNLNSITDLRELEKALSKASTIKCSEPAFTFLNISMAGWNTLYCLSLLTLTIYLNRKTQK